MKPGDLLAAKYRLTRVIGKGAMGEVWSAVNESTQGSVALKIIPNPSPELWQRVVREARAGGSLKHRNIVDVYDVGETEGGDPFLVMELLSGETLAQRLWRLGRFPPGEAVEIAGAIARALRVAHARGIVHRDLKPANVFIHREADAEDEVVKVLDFGVSKHLEDASATVTGGLVGSPAYMSPEQARADARIDARSDLWSFGILLFEMLAGRRPFVSNSPYVVITEVLTAPIPSLSTVAPDVGPGLAQVVEACLQRDLSERVASADALIQLLRPFQDGATASIDLAPPLLEVEVDGEELSDPPDAPVADGGAAPFDPRARTRPDEGVEEQTRLEGRPIRTPVVDDGGGARRSPEPKPPREAPRRTLVLPAPPGVEESTALRPPTATPTPHLGASALGAPGGVPAPLRLTAPSPSTLPAPPAPRGPLPPPPPLTPPIATRGPARSPEPPPIAPPPPTADTSMNMDETVQMVPGSVMPWRAAIGAAPPPAPPRQAPPVAYQPPPSAPHPSAPPLPPEAAPTATASGTAPLVHSRFPPAPPRLELSWRFAAAVVGGVALVVFTSLGLALTRSAGAPPGGATASATTAPEATDPPVRPAQPAAPPASTGDPQVPPAAPTDARPARRPGENEALIVVDAPEGTQVSLDGQPVGPTPIAPMSATAGAHRLFFKHPSLGERVVVVTAQGGETTLAAPDFDSKLPQPTRAKPRLAPGEKRLVMP